MRASALLIGLFVLAATGAQTAGAASKETGCFATAETQYAMDMCAGQDFKKADDALNALYRQMMSRYKPEDQTLLRDAERKWLAYRDAECVFDSNSTVGGDFHPTAEAMCRTKKTEARIKEIKTQIDCPEGDLGCNRPGK